MSKSPAHRTWTEVQQDTTDFAKDDPDIQSKFPIASFTVRGTRVAFAIELDELTGGNRLVRHKRPYRKGAKLDSTGAEEREWTCTAIFNNTIVEPGLDPDVPQYPDLLQSVMDLFDAQETGDLVTPTDGKGRFRASKYVRSTGNDETDTARLKLTFIEDNEDAVDASAFSRPNVKGSLSRLADQAVFTAMSEGAWNGNLADLKEFCANLEGVINAPGETADSVVVQARAAQHAITDVLRTVQRQSSNDSPLQTINRLKQLLDVSAWSLEEHNLNPPRRIKYVVTSITTIWAIAADVKQNADDLLELNDGRIDDPFAVQPGTYRVLAPN